MVNKRVLINGDSWTLLTNKASLIQFNGDAYMYINDVANVPAGSVGFTMTKGEKYISSTNDIYVYSKSAPGTDVHSVTVLEV